MLIDVAFLIFILIAVIKGFRKGLIVGIFSLIAFVIGLAAALKLSVVVADYLETHLIENSRWLPFISFFLVFIAVVLLVSLGARLIRSVVKIAMLGWLDRLAGIVFFVVLYTFIFSILLFYAEKMLIIQPEVITASKTYPFVAPWGTIIINSLGEIIPWFKGLFEELQLFFEGLSHKTVTMLW